MSWGMFGSESPGWSYALAGHHRADLTGTGGAVKDHGGNPSPAPHRLLPAWKSPDVLDVGRAVDLLQAPQHIAGVKGPGDAAGAAGVNMAGPGVEAVIVLRRALAPLASWNPVRWLKAIRFTLRFHRGSRVRTGILPPLLRYDLAQLPLEVEPAPARDFGT